MGTTKNSQGLSAAVEFIQDPRLDLDALEEMQVLGPGFEFPLDPTTGITFEDILEAPPEDVPDVFSTDNTSGSGKNGNILSKSDLFRCDPNTRDLIPIDCSTCAKDPTAIVPDWRELVSDSIFFDQRRCTYSVVLDTGIEGIPTSDFVAELLKIRGLKLILEDLNKVETFTTVTYEPRKQDNANVSAEDAAIQTGIALTATSLVGAKVLMPFGIGSILVGMGIAALATPGKKNGYRRILSEYETVPTLLETTIQDPIIAGSDSNAAVVIEYYVPTTPGVPSRALVSVDSAVIENVPRIVDSQPTADFSSLEVTIAGSDYPKMFRDVSRNLDRANTFALDAQKNKQYLKVYPTTGTDIDKNTAMILDFSDQANELIRFQDEVLSPAIYAVLGIRLSQLEKVIIGFEETDNNKLRIKEVSANRIGCELVNFSEFRSKSEVRDLFNFKRTITLGYVLQLPNMMSDLLGQADIVWLDWLTRYTYPGIEFRSANPYGLSLPGVDDMSTLACLAEQTKDQIVNGILNSVMAAGNLFINSISAELCPPERDALIEEDEFKKARKELRKKIRKASPYTAFGIQSEKDVYKEQLDELTADKRAETRAKFQKYMRANLNSEKYLKNEPLARILALNIVYGVDHMASKNATKGSLAADARAAGLSGPLLVPRQPKPFNIDNVQSAMDSTLGGWCGWIALTLEALQCVAKGMGIDDYRETVVKAALGKMTPWQFQKLFSRMDPATRERIRQAMLKAVGTGEPGSPSILFPWENEFNESHTYDKNRVVNALIEQQLAFDEKLNLYREADPTGESLTDDYVREIFDIETQMAAKEAEEREAELQGNRTNTPAGPWSAALGGLQAELTDILIDSMIESAGIDTLFDLLDDMPGFAIIEKLIDEKPCLLPKLPFVNPPLDSFLKTLNIEICKSQGGKVDVTLPRFVGVPSGTRNIFQIISQKGNEILLAIAAQLLVQTLTITIQAVLDAACNILALGGASLADAINGNTEFTDRLKEAICPPRDTLTGQPISDEDFNQAMLNILDALTNGDTDRDCVKELTPQVMGEFIDAVMVSLTYQQLFQLVLGNPTPQTLDIITALANNLGHECLAIIFGDPKNVLNYFKTVGDLIDAEGIFEEFPEGGIPNINVGICPPEVLDYVNELRANLLSDKGLTPEQIQQQLDFLADQAKKNLEDILEGLEEGPYAGLPPIQSDSTCPDDGIYSDYDYAMDSAFDISLNAIFTPIEQRQLKDLVGIDGVFNNVLADTNGRRLRTHRFLANGLFGNSIGASNFLFQFYSDDTLRLTEIEENNDQQYIDAQKSRRIDQFGNRVDIQNIGTGLFGGPVVAPFALGEPHGGFPPTVGAMLMRKLKKQTLGKAEGSGPEDAELIKYKTKFTTPKDLERYEKNLRVSQSMIAKRRLALAKWAAATAYVDYDTLKPHLLDLDEDGNVQYDRVLETNPETGESVYVLKERLFNLRTSSRQIIDQVAKLEGTQQAYPRYDINYNTVAENNNYYIDINSLEDRQEYFNSLIELASDLARIGPIDKIIRDTYTGKPDPIRTDAAIGEYLALRNTPNSVDSNLLVVLGAIIDPSNDDYYLQGGIRGQNIDFRYDSGLSLYEAMNASKKEAERAATFISNDIIFKQVNNDGVFGINYQVYELFKLLLNRNYILPTNDEETLASVPKGGNYDSIKASLTSDQSVDVFDMRSSNEYFIKRPINLELMKLYVEVAEAFNGRNLPDLKEPKSSDLDMSYVTYGYPLSPDLSPLSGRTVISDPHWGFDLKYDNNPQQFVVDASDGLLNARIETRPEPFIYRVKYTEIINPFDSDDLIKPKSYRDTIRQQKLLTKADVDILEVAPPVTRGVYRQEVTYFDRNITSTPSIEVQNYLNFLAQAEKIRNLVGQRSYESEYFLRFLNQNIAKDFDSLRASGLGSNFIINNNNRRLANNLFDFINDGFVKRISDFIGRGDGTSRILVADKKGQIKSNPNKQNKLNEEKGKTISCPQGFKFGFDIYQEPEVEILDYRIYGGTPENPPFYVKPPKYDGWMGLLSAMLPESDGCEPARKPIYNMDQIKQKSKDLYNKLKDDKRLQMVPTCTQEAPYDSIYDRATAANMDAMLRAIARVNALDFILKAVPVFSQFEINFDSNFDQLLSTYLSEYTLQKVLIADQKGRRPLIDRVDLLPDNVPVMRPGKVAVNDYYYAVLEQTGYLIAKRIEAGDLELEDLSLDQQEAFIKIAETVENYYKDFDGTLGILSEEAIQIQNIFKKVFNKAATRRASTAGLGRGSESFSKREAKKVKTGLLYAVLKQTEQEASTLFSKYVEEEIQSFAPLLNSIFNPSVDSMDLLFFSHPEWINGSVADGANESAVSLASKVLNLTGDQGPYHVTSDPTNPKKFNISLDRFSDRTALLRDDDDLPKEGRWPFVLEMYATIENKDANLFDDPTLVDVFNKRPINMPNNGVINLLDLQKFIDDINQNNNYSIFGDISDYFGPKIFELDEDPTSDTYGQQIIKNTGIKFGLRLSMCFDQGDPRANMFRELAAGASESVLMKTKAYNLKKTVSDSQTGTEILIPLVSAELPARDQSIRSFNIDQYDLICLINEMIKKTEFKTLFGYIFPYRRFLSLFTIYVANSFYESIGNAGRPDQGGDRWAIPGGRIGTGFRKWDKEAFESTNNILKKSFLTLYRTKNPVADIGDRDEKDQARTLKDLLAPLFPDNLLDGMPWWQRRMRRNRPYDAFGNVCDTEDDL